MIKYPNSGCSLSKGLALQTVSTNCCLKNDYALLKIRRAFKPINLLKNKATKKVKSLAINYFSFKRNVEYTNWYKHEVINQYHPFLCTSASPRHHLLRPRATNCLTNVASSQPDRLSLTEANRASQQADFHGAWVTPFKRKKGKQLLIF